MEDKETIEELQRIVPGCDVYDNPAMRRIRSLARFAAMNPSQPNPVVELLRIMPPGTSESTLSEVVEAISPGGFAKLEDVYEVMAERYQDDPDEEDEGEDDEATKRWKAKLLRELPGFDELQPYRAVRPCLTAHNLLTTKDQQVNLQIERLIDELGEPFTVAIDLDTKVWDSMIGEIADAYTKPNFGEMVIGTLPYILVGPEWHTTRVKVVAGEVVFGWEDNYHKPGDPIYQAVLAAFKAAKAATS